MIKEERMRKALVEADLAFWEAIAKAYPEVTTGDLCFSTVLPFSAAQVKAVKAWILTNT